MTRVQAEILLKQVFGLNRFYDEQWTVIERLLKGERVLLIERTGFGKSLCYQFPAVLQEGVTVVFSPLIALMRDQVRSLTAKGIPARCIHSGQTSEENAETLADALSGEVKILYIAPERQNSEEWQEKVRKMKLSMVVVDEAHTISVWGHDFRPAFRRIIRLVNLLPKHLPVLAVTATATLRVQQDIEKQIGGKLITVRGNLMRENFHLYVVETESEEEKMVALARWLKQRLPGCGLVYTGTRMLAELYAEWLASNGIDCVEYHAGLSADRRKEIEQGLMENRWKCIVSTNALGMGIDKPDIRFVIHTQIPVSPVHYYQEIGRAGRDGKMTVAILFYNSAKGEDGVSEDYRLPKSFIESGRPPAKVYQKIIGLLKEEPLGERELMKKTDLGQTSIRVVKADLVEQGIVKEVKYEGAKRYEYQHDAPPLETAGFEELRKAKLRDLDKMIEYVYTDQPRMKFLCEYLGDSCSAAEAFKGCDNTDLLKHRVRMTDSDWVRVREFQMNCGFTLVMESAKTNMVNGVAATYYGVSSVGLALHRCKYGDGQKKIPGWLLKITIKAYYKLWEKDAFDLILYVPPTISGDLVKDFAHRLGKALEIPVFDWLQKTRTTEPQKSFQNHILKKDNVADAFALEEGKSVDGKKILLVDDICGSGATLKEIGKMLTGQGAAMIAPLVIAKTVRNGFL